MVDEIQTGFGRTGRWFGFEHDGVAPDVVTLAKAMGNGMPIGACWARKDVAAVFEPGDHGSTYSGTAIATAAVNAVIAEMRRLDAPALADPAGRAARRRRSAACPASVPSGARASSSPPSSPTTTRRPCTASCSPTGSSRTRSRRPRCASPRP